MKASILAASDDIKVRELLRQAIQAEGLESVLCGDGLEALESLKQHEQEKTLPQLIILEAFLPKIDGYEVINHAQNLSSARAIPILMLIGKTTQGGGASYQSGAISPQTLANKIRLRADNYLQKPFELKEIQSEVHSMVKYRRPHNGPHPVSSLAGHPQMEQEIFNRLVRGETFAALWFDINHFRPYNDHYGSARGDEVLKMAIDLIQKTIQTIPFEAGQKPFLAHVDGDDFILLVPKERADQIKQNLRGQFQEAVLKFYKEEDRAKGFFFGKGRDQKEQVFPLMSLSMASLNVMIEKFVHYGQFVSESNELLRQAKVGAQDVK